jgi:SUZ domain
MGECVRPNYPQGHIFLTQFPFYYRNATSPMPEVVIVQSSTASSVVPTAASAFRSPMRILKRPSPNPSASTSSSSLTSDLQSRQSLAEREARYQVARERIFKSDQEVKNVDEKSPCLETSRREAGTVVGVVRNPRGPASINEDISMTGDAVRGFAGRKKAPLPQEAGSRPVPKPPSNSH